MARMLDFQASIDGPVIWLRGIQEELLERVLTLHLAPQPTEVLEWMDQHHAMARLLESLVWMWPLFIRPVSKAWPRYPGLWVGSVAIYSPCPRLRPIWQGASARPLRKRRRAVCPWRGRSGGPYPCSTFW